MQRCLLVALQLALLASSVALGDEEPLLKPPREPERQFDFWLGEWRVENQQRKNDEPWKTTGIAAARIDSVLGGRAVLERWRGDAALPLRGFSLRTYDREQQRWEIVLNWHSGSPSSFSLMTGNFSGNRGEFLPPQPPKRVRFTFSEPRASSCQWDQATSADGVAWRTNWIMQFQRTQAPRTVDAKNLTITKPPANASKFPRSRQLDGLIGVWQGEAKRRTEDGWEKGVATRRVTSMIDGLGLLQMTDFSWGEQSIAALSFDAQRNLWFEVGMSTSEADCHWLAGSWKSAEAFRLNEQESSDNGVNHVWRSLAPNSFTWIREQPDPRDPAKSRPTVTVAFQRQGDEGRTQPPKNVKPTLAAKLAPIQTLLGQGQFVSAEKQLRELAKAHASDPRPHYFLGYALHAQKKYDEAMTWYAKALSGPRLRASAEYNMACLSALTGNKDEAFQHLDAAVKAGFNNLSHIATDTDLKSLRDDPRFSKFAPRILKDGELFAEPTRIIHKFVGESANGQFGWTARRVGDWDRDGVIDFVATAPTQGGGGKVYVYSSKSGKLLFSKSGKKAERFGNSAVGAGDVNGDGAPDLIVGAPNGPAKGNAYVFSGKDGKLIHHFSGTATGDNFGYEVSELGDIDGDGRADLLVGATNSQGANGSAGKIFAYSGKTGEPLFTLEGERAGDSFGNAAAAVKLPGKKEFLLAIGAQNAGPNRRGRVYVYRLLRGQPQLAFRLEGDANSVNFGQMFIAFPGDINGDQIPDVYASDFSDKTRAPGGGKVIIASGVDGKLLTTIYGARAGEGLGTSPSDAGDVNGDGVGDLVIGAWQNNEGAASGGKVYLHDGKTGKLLRAWTCKQSGDTFGFDACGIGDVDGDGAVDFLLTSAWSNVGGQKTGRVFILAGDKTYAGEREAPTPR